MLQFFKPRNASRLILNIASDVRRYGIRVAWSNIRFGLGYRIGGFSAARR